MAAPAHAVRVARARSLSHDGEAGVVTGQRRVCAVPVPPCRRPPRPPPPRPRRDGCPRFQDSLRSDPPRLSLPLSRLFLRVPLAPVRSAFITGRELASLRREVGTYSALGGCC